MVAAPQWTAGAALGDRDGRLRQDVLARRVPGLCL